MSKGLVDTVIKLRIQGQPFGKREYTYLSAAGLGKEVEALVNTYAQSGTLDDMKVRITWEDDTSEDS